MSVANLFGVKPNYVPCDQTYQVDVCEWIYPNACSNPPKQTNTHVYYFYDIHDNGLCNRVITGVCC
jgi:hypothetical protein